MTILRSRLPACCQALICTLMFFLAVPAGAGAEETLRFDIATQPLVPALKAFAEQSNMQLLYKHEAVEKATATAVVGTFGKRSALEQLLKGTGLEAVFTAEDAATIRAKAAGKASAEVAPRDPIRLVQVVEENKHAPPAEGISSEYDDSKSEIRVTGSRISRDPAEADSSPVTVFTRQDIERSGAVDMSEFVGRITQASTSVTIRETDNEPLAGRTTVNLRGLGNNTTLILLNGRRLPRAGQGFGQDAYNLNGIPLAFVERIEVLGNSASAIYGADAIGGVINIITRDDFRGMETSVRYGNTFDSDVSERVLNLIAGTAGVLGAGRKKYAVTVNLGANDHNGLSALDRPYTARSDYSGTGGTPPSGFDPFFSIGGGAGVVMTLLDFFNPFPDNLPFLNTTAVAIPQGQNGRTLSIADFDESAPLETSDGDLPAYRELLSPAQELSGALNATVQLTDWIQLFADASYFRSRTTYTGLPPTGDMTVPATNPFNPFDVPVTVRKVFYELGPSRGISETRNSSLASGVRGDVFGDWRYELSGSFTRYIGDVTNPTPTSINFFEEDSPGNRALAETVPILSLNPFGDGRTTRTNDPNLLRSILGVDDYRETSDSLAAAFQADGPVFPLPGGTVKVAVGGEYRDEKVNFDKVNTTGTIYGSLDVGAHRDVSAVFAEVSVPMVGEAQNIPMARSLQLSLAGRVDSESIFGEEFTPRAGLIWRPVPELAVRTAYSEGYKVPNIQQLFEPELRYNGRIFFPVPFDPVTGEMITRNLDIVDGGNLGLQPERSTSWSAGLIYEPRWARGLSLSADYFDIDYTNKVMSFFDAQIFLNLFPERVTRDPATRRVTGIDKRSINLAAATARGIDVRLIHRMQTARHGGFDTHLNFTYNIDNTSQATPASRVIENVDGPFFPRVRGNLDLFWNYGGLELGPTITYEASTRNFLPFGATAPVRIRHATEVDLQGSYQFDGLRGETVPHWTRGVKITLGIDNVFDLVPSPTDGGGGYARVDPRQRRFYVSLRKSFF